MEHSGNELVHRKPCGQCNAARTKTDRFGGRLASLVAFAANQQWSSAPHSISVIRERVKSGLERARAQGKALGRPAIDAEKEAAISADLRLGKAGIMKLA